MVNYSCFLKFILKFVLTHDTLYIDGMKVLTSLVVIILF